MAWSVSNISASGNGRNLSEVIKIKFGVVRVAELKLQVLTLPSPSRWLVSNTVNHWCGIAIIVLKISLEYQWLCVVWTLWQNMSKVACVMCCFKVVGGKLPLGNGELGIEYASPRSPIMIFIHQISLWFTVCSPSPPPH